MVGTWTTEGRLNRLVMRYLQRRLAPGETFSIEESRLATCGGGLAASPAIRSLMRAPAPLRGVDPSVSYDIGAELNAVATLYLYAVRQCYAAPPDGEELADLRRWFDRHLEAYFTDLFAADSPGKAAIFTRGLAFVMLGLDCMVRATGDQVYALRLGAALDLLLAAQAPDVSNGAFQNTGTSESYLDCHAAAMLALARLARPGCDSRVIPALRRALGALRLGTVMVPLGEQTVPFDTIVVRSIDRDGRWTEDGASWSYKAGLLLRSLQATLVAAKTGVLPLTKLELERLQMMQQLCIAHIRHVSRDRPDELEFLTSRHAGETNSETQPWVMLGLWAPDQSLPKPLE